MTGSTHPLMTRIVQIDHTLPRHTIPRDVPLKQILTWGLPAALTCCYGLLAFQGNLSLQVPLLVGASAVIVMLSAVGIYAAERGAAGWSPAVILVFAAVFRLLFVLRPPELSDDFYRYVWDGLQTLRGQNPYPAAPASVTPWSEASMRLLQLINHPDVPTIYPPGAQWVFAPGVAFTEGGQGLKVLLVVMDLVVCALHIRLLTSMKLPASRSVLYAWHPLPVLEIGASGHIDGAGVLFFLLSLVLLKRAGADVSSGKASFFAVSAGMAFAWAVLVKLFPVIFLPGLLMPMWGDRRILAEFLLGMLGGIVILSFPFLPELFNVFEVLSLYARHWEFGGFLFRTLRGIGASGNAARLLLSLFFVLVAGFLYNRLWAVRYRGRPAGGQGLGRSACPCPSHPGFDSQVLGSFYSVALVFLLLSPTLYPWYALYMVCLLPFKPEPPGIVFSWAVLLSYRVLISYRLLGVWQEDDFAPLLIFGSTVSAMVCSRRAGKGARPDSDLGI